MPESYVREIGRVEDIDGHSLAVGVDHDTATIGWPGGVHWRLNFGPAEEFTKLFAEAYQAAAANWERMRADA